jgi:hypothetical protein
MTYLRQILVLKEAGDLFFIQSLITPCEGAEVLQFIILDVCPILLCEQILVDPTSAALRKNDAPVHVLVEALLEDSTAQVVGLAFITS